MHPTQVVADASPVGLRAVLTQTHKDGSLVISLVTQVLALRTLRRILADEEGDFVLSMGL